MNISVYLPDNLKSNFETYIKSHGITKNAAIRKAVELLLKNDNNKKWGNWINHLESDPEFPGIDEIRMDLNAPREDFF